MKKLLILMFLVSCSSPDSNISSNNTKLTFDDNLSFEEFNELLIQYSKTSPYPNIDKQIMKKIILLIFLSSCSFQAKKNTLDIQYLKIKDLSLGEFQYSLNKDIKKKRLIK